MHLNAAVDFGRGVSEAWARVAVFAPKLLLFVIILAIGYLVAKALGKIANRILIRVGFDRAAERGGVTRALARSRYEPRGLVTKLVYYSILLITLQTAFGIWGPNPVSRLLDGIVSFLPKLAVAIIIVVVAAAVARAIRDIVSSVLGGLSYGRLLGNIASAIVLFLGIIAALEQIEVATAVTTPVLIAVLATIGGTIIVGVGGGLVRPISHRWEEWLTTIRREVNTVRVEVASRNDSYPLPDDESSTVTTGSSPTSGPGPNGATPGRSGP